jgi:triphosphatase
MPVAVGGCAMELPEANEVKQRWAADRAFAVLRLQFAEFLARERGAASGDDPEDVHRMRVATRRLRAALRVFEDVLPSDVRAARDEFQWVAQALGAVRDRDVQIEYLGTLRDSSAPEDVPTYASLIAEFEQLRAAARADLLVLLASERYADLVRTFREGLLAGPSDASRKTAVQLARRTIPRRARRFRRAAIGVDAAATLAEFHAVRIRAKRLRYSLELFQDLDPLAARRGLKALRRLQDQLGEVQDLATLNEDLRAIARSEGHRLAPETLVLMGQLIERHRLGIAVALAAYPDARDNVLKRQRRLRRALRGS